MRSLTLAYALAGADCIDVAADRAVTIAAREALSVAAKLAPEAKRLGYGRLSGATPLLMVSLNDGEDPHFRKAEFNPAVCPPDCPRPCESICPAGAIAFPSLPISPIFPDGDKGEWSFSGGVIEERCYGCGRCLPVCPIGHIITRSYVSTPEAVAANLLPDTGVEAIEIHTQIGRLADFTRLWRAISPLIQRLKLIAISCPDGDGLIDYLWSLYQLISPLPCPLIWQTDGRPMSGDIGKGTTHATIKLGQKVLGAGPPGFVQLAGGTNNYTASKLLAAGLLKNSGLPGSVVPENHNSKSFIAGIAFGSYARVLLSPILDQLETGDFSQLNRSPRLEDEPKLLWQAVELAHELVNQLKSPFCSTIYYNEIQT